MAVLWAGKGNRVVFGMSLWNTIKTLITPQPVEVVAEEPLTDDEKQFLDIIRKKNQSEGGPKNERRNNSH